MKKNRPTETPNRRQADALFAQAMARHRGGDAAGAVPLYRQILAADPKHANALHFLGVAQRQLGAMTEAARLMAESIDADPSVPAFLGNFASLCLELGHHAQAIDCYRRLSVLDPANPIPHIELARLAMRAHRPIDAAASYLAARTRSADSPDLLFAIGELQHEGGLHADALASFEQLLRLQPRHPQALNHLGGVLEALGRVTEAVAAYRRALAIDPTLAAAWNNLGNTLASQYRLAEAEEALRKAIRIDPAYVRAHSNLGIVLKNAGCLDAAIEAFREALRLDPTYPKARHNLLFTLNNSEAISPEALAAEHRSFGALFDRPRAAATRGDDPERRLRVGYVSGDLRRHPVGYFLEAIFAHHDPAASELFCYATSPLSDDLSRELKRASARWCDAAFVDDEALAKRIREDRIDILVDLAGHTEHNRLLCFSLRPAPIQVTYLGYANTTGMSSIDYRISDWLADPESSAGLCSEALIRVANSYYCYQPRPEAPPVAPLPALARGTVSFGCCLNLAKASPASLRLWSEVLAAVPESRLILRASAFSDEACRLRTLSRLVALGVAPERIQLLPHAAFPSHLATYADIDIGLDTFPFNLATNAVEALWQGVPMVTLAGRTSPSRMGLSIMTAAGLPQLAAPTAADYVAIAAGLAADLPALAKLRHEMRDRLATSPLLDGEAAARALDAAYRTMWVRHCATGLRPAN